MKVAIYAPNISRTSGGAETYAIGIAEVLMRVGYEVTFFAAKRLLSRSSTNDIYRRFGTSTFNTRYVWVYPFSMVHPIIKEVCEFPFVLCRTQIEKEYDLFINCSVGITRGVKNIPSIHIIHFPSKRSEVFLPKIIGRKIDDAYLSSYRLLLANSRFTQKYVKEYWGIDCQVLNPPIRMAPLKYSSSRENIIIAVGRIVKDKKIDAMIIAFKRLCDQGLQGYKFIVAGNVDEKDTYIDDLKHVAENYPVEFRCNISQKELLELYRKSKIFWHAKGYDTESTNPYKMEHFGMTTAEAMINGCVPVVIDRAGQKEIVENDYNGKRWNTLDELVCFTKEIIDNPNKMIMYSENAISSATKYTMPYFENKLISVLHTILK